MNLDLNLTFYTKKLKMNHRFKCKRSNYKGFRGKNINENLLELRFGEEFLDVTPKASPIKGKFDKLNFIKI